MNIFVTVGTTKFESLIINVDNYALKNKALNFTFQVSDSGEYLPRNGPFFSFINNINELYESADLIITHAGAGSIYTLLEMNKKLIIVPNLERVDKHQSDISNFMAMNQHALVCSDVTDIGSFIEMAKDFQFIPFQKISFFKAEEIADFINN